MKKWLIVLFILFVPSFVSAQNYVYGPTDLDKFNNFEDVDGLVFDTTTHRYKTLSDNTYDFGGLETHVELDLNNVSNVDVKNGNLYYVYISSNSNNIKFSNISTFGISAQDSNNMSFDNMYSEGNHFSSLMLFLNCNNFKITDSNFNNIGATFVIINNSNGSIKNTKLGSQILLQNSTLSLDKVTLEYGSNAITMTNSKLSCINSNITSRSNIAIVTDNNSNNELYINGGYYKGVFRSINFISNKFTIVGGEFESERDEGTITCNYSDKILESGSKMTLGSIIPSDNGYTTLGKKIIVTPSIKIKEDNYYLDDVDVPILEGNASNFNIYNGDKLLSSHDYTIKNNSIIFNKNSVSLGVNRITFIYKYNNHDGYSYDINVIKKEEPTTKPKKNKKKKYKNPQTGDNIELSFIISFIVILFLLSKHIIKM